jgi:hypothetical protein
MDVHDDRDVMDKVNREQKRLGKNRPLMSADLCTDPAV